MLHVVYTEGADRKVAEADVDVFSLHVGDDLALTTGGREERYVVGALGPTRLEGGRLVTRVALRPELAA